MNRLLFGDNLKWLRDKNVFPDAGVVELGIEIGIRSAWPNQAEKIFEWLNEDS